MRQFFGFLTGIIVGVVVGSTVALLLAPEPGEVVRNDLRTRGEALVADVRHAAETRRIELSNRLEALREPRASETAGS